MLDAGCWMCGCGNWIQFYKIRKRLPRTFETASIKKTIIDRIKECS